MTDCNCQVLAGFASGQILVAEMNKGQMLTLLRSQYLLDAKGLQKVSGQPLKIVEVEKKINETNNI